MKEILKNRLYITTLIADLISNFGDILYYLALLNYVLQIEQSELAISIINVSEILPVLFAFLIGYYADKNKNRVSTIIRTLVLRIVLYLIVAVVIGFSPSLLIVIAVSFINFISDLSGQYENSLYYPISNRLVHKEIREEVMAFRQSLTMSLNVLFQAAGGVLICYISFQKLALVNAATFMVSLLIIGCVRLEMQKYCDDGAENDKIGNVQEEKQSVKELLRSLKTELTEAIRLLWQIPSIKETLAVIPILNAGLAVVTPLAVLCMAQNPAFCVIGSEVTISLLAICETAGRIVGSALTISAFKKVKLTTAIKIVLAAIVLLFVGMIAENIYIVLGALFFASLWTGCIDPKMGAAIFNNLKEKKLATAFGGMTTYFQLGDIISKMIFSILVLGLGTKAISSVYIVITSFAMIMLFMGKKET
ncbi:MAG: hypothetical protein NC433_03000 [Clostridiales bacterium]|nr:hypothetical protein [Clostridiales bacterium]